MRYLAAFFIIFFAFLHPALAATDVKNDGSLGASLDAAWFGSNQTITTDLTANGSTLTNVNSVGSVTSPNTGETAADFEYSSSTHFTRADNAFISFTSAMSVAFWINFESYGTGIQSPMLLRKYGVAGSRDYILEWSVSGSTLTPRFQYFDGASYRDASASTGSTVNTGTWYHYCVTFDAGSVIYYVNGSKLGTTRTVGGTAIADGAGTLYISSDNGAASQIVDGKVHQLLMYNKVLTAGDCSALYNAGTELPWIATAQEATTTPFMNISGDVTISGDVIIRQ
jgi:hypothetical protein